MQNAFLEILPATGRAADLSEEDDLYGFLIGSWDLDVTAYPDDGDAIRTKGEAHVARVLEGRAVQDLFINPRRSDRNADSSSFGNWFGTTFRFYDPTIHAWRANWFNPLDGFRAELVARRRGNDIVQEGTFPDGTKIRWTYSEITDDSCHWRGERLESDGKTWHLQIEFRTHRIH